MVIVVQKQRFVLKKHILHRSKQDSPKTYDTSRYVHVCSSYCFQGIASHQTTFRNQNPFCFWMNQSNFLAKLWRDQCKDFLAKPWRQTGVKISRTSWMCLCQGERNSRSISRIFEIFIHFSIIFGTFSG